MALKLNSSGGGSVTLDAPATANNYTLTAPASSGTIATTDGGNTTFTSITDSGNLTFTGTGNRITGDFSSSTAANRISFQSSIANGQTNINAIPNGTGTSSAFTLFNSADTANSSVMQMFALSTATGLSSFNTGTGTYLPMTFYTGGSERMRIATNGAVTFTKDQSIVNLVSSGAFNPTLNFYSSTSTLEAGIVAAQGGASLLFTTGASGTERMRIDSSGNVGVGTSSPATKLQVKSNGELFRLETTGTVSSGGSGYQTWVDSTGSRQAYLGFGGANNTFQINVDANGPLTFSTAGSERMRIASSGKVGIGLSNPDGFSGVLSVGGTISSGAAIGVPTLESYANTTTYPNGAVLDFPNFSGMIIANSSGAAGGQCYVMVCGGGTVSLLGGSGAQVGAWSYNSGVNGYRWTNNTGVTQQMAFMAFRTRLGA